MYPKIFLKPEKAQALQRQHLWVFSGAILRTEPQIQNGDIVELYVHNQYLATGHYQAHGSIAIRILTFQQQLINTVFYEQKIKNALTVRHILNLPNSATNAYRLIHAEGDSLPALIIDIYNHTAVIQTHSEGMFRQKEIITNALLKVMQPFNLQAIFYKTNNENSNAQKQKTENHYLHNPNLFENETIITENNTKYAVNWHEGQKTGFFIDQRTNRQLLKEYAHKKNVLNTFCYTGGFSVYALHAGANQVHSIDASAKAIQYTQKNIELNGFDSKQNACIVGDVVQYLQKDTTPYYDLIIVDPPAFAKNLDKKHAAVQGYIRLNELAIQKINPKKGGILFTFSCSQVIDKQLFVNSITAAAIRAKRQIRILHHLSQAPDHPTNICHPEGDYLKGLVLHVF